jgi:hypothetical protein
LDVLGPCGLPHSGQLPYPRRVGVLWASTAGVLGTAWLAVLRSVAVSGAMCLLGTTSTAGRSWHTAVVVLGTVVVFGQCACSSVPTIRAFRARCGYSARAVWPIGLLQPPGGAGWLPCSGLSAC